MNSFLIALQFLTRIPVQSRNYSNEEIKNSVYWYGAAGLIIGLTLYLALLVMQWLLPDAPSSVIAALLLGLWVMITGALHIDGLADSADAWLGGTSAEKALLIMKDPRSGPAGVTAILIVLLLKYACLQSLIQQQAEALIMVPAIARAFIPILFFYTRYVREQGLGEHFSQGLNGQTIFFQTGAIVLLGWFLAGATMVMALALSIIAYFALRRLMIKRLGGTTGDTAGGLIEVLEATLLLGFVG